MNRIAGVDPTDTTFQLLTHRLRREILCLLDTEGDTLTAEELTETLATIYDASEQDIAVALEHVHLPKLQQVDFIDYDDRSGDIRYRGSELIELLQENDCIECETCSGDR
jgi:hypothetical protein